MDHWAVAKSLRLDQLYRQRELIGDKFKAFQLTSLLTKDAFDLHLSKMAD